MHTCHFLQLTAAFGASRGECIAGCNALHSGGNATASLLRDAQVLPHPFG